MTNYNIHNAYDPVKIYFNKGMNKTSVFDAKGGGMYQGAFSLCDKTGEMVHGTGSWIENTFIFNPSSTLKPFETCSIRITAEATDQSGNAIKDPFEAQFRVYGKYTQVRELTIPGVRGFDFDNSNNLYAIFNTGNQVAVKYDGFDSNSIDWPLECDFATDLKIEMHDDQDYIYITAPGEHRILKYDWSGGLVGWIGKGTIVTGWHETDSVEGYTNGTGNGEFDSPAALDFDSNGYIYVADTGNHRIQVMNENFTYERQWGEFGEEKEEFNQPVALAIDSDDYIYVADMGNHRIQKFSNSGEWIRSWGSEGTEAGQFQNPVGITVTGDNDIYVTDRGNRRIQHFDSNGRFITAWGTQDPGNEQFQAPFAVAIDEDGFVYVSDEENNRITVFEITN